MFLRQDPSRSNTRGMYRPSVDHGVGAGKINILEDAQRFLFCMTVFPPGNNSVPAENQNFSRFHIPDEFCTDCRYRTAFRSHNIHSFFGFSITKRSESVRVSGTDQFLRGHQYQGIGAVQCVHCPAECFLNRWCSEPFLGYDIGNGFCIAGSMENRAGKLQC